MMKHKMMKLAILVSMICIGTIPMTVSAAVDQHIKVDTVLALEFEPTANYMEVTQELAEDGLEITMNASSQDSFLYLHQNYVADWSLYNAFAMQIENQSDLDAQLVVHIQVSEEENMNLSAGALVLMKDATSDEYTTQRLEQDFVQIPPDFKGELIIPFTGIVSPEMEDLFMNQYLSMFENVFEEDAEAGNAKDIFLRSVASWGMTFLPQVNEEQTIIISEIGLVNAAKHEWVSEVGKYILQGESDVSIPVMGEAIARYDVIGTTHEVYSLSETDMPGITLDEQGVLTVTAEAEEQDLVIIAMVDEGYVLKQEVSLSKEWMEYEVDENGNPYYIVPITAQFAVNNKLSLYEELTEYGKSVATAVWITAGFVWMIYIIYRIKWKLNKKRNEEKAD